MINQDYNFSKYKNSILIIMLFIVGLLFTLSTIWYVKNKMELLKEKQFQQEKIYLKQKLRNLLETKRKAVMSIAVVMSKDITIQEYLEHKRDINIHKLIVDISDSLRKNTDYKNIWLHIIDKNGVSLARSWSNQAGDSIYNIRKDIRDIIKSPHITSRMSVGKFSMTLKSIVPIFDEKGKFIGIVEGISHFNSIIKKLKKDGIESIVLVDKKYNKQLTKNITHTFINDYYVVNFNPPKKILNLVKDKGVKYFINNREYKVFDNYYTFTYPIKDIDGEILGYFIVLENKNKLINKEINEFIDNTIVFSFAVLFGLIVIFIIFYKSRLNIEKQKEYFKKIFDSTKDIIVVTDLNRIIDVNRAFLEFFNIKELDEFNKINKCICDFFEEEEGYVSKEVESQNCIEYIFNHSDIEHKVKIKQNDKIYYFSVKIQKLIENEDGNLYVVVFSDITQIEISRKELRRLSITDALTNIGNREFFNENIEKEINRAKRYKTPLSLLMFDLDFFKKVNDNYGHDVGDIVLQEVSKAVKKVLRNTDIFCRYGGEEFMIIMPETSLNEAIILAERIRKTVENLQIPPVKQITISIGVTELKEDDTIETFIKRVDDSLYQSKENGRNQVTSL